MAIRHKWIIRRSHIVYFIFSITLFVFLFQTSILNSLINYLGSFITKFDATDHLLSFLNQAPILRERLLLIDRNVLREYQTVRISGELNCLFCNVASYQPITFGLVAPANRSLEEHVLLPILRAWEVGFWVEQILYSKPTKFSLLRLNLPLGFILQKGGGSVIFEIVLLHQREGDFWWHGSFSQDSRYEEKLTNLKITSQRNNLILNRQGAYDKVRFESVTLDGLDLNVPLNVKLFLDTKSTFVECNYERADKFHRLYGRDTSARANMFRHRVRKLLALTKAILDDLRIPFWISSGTCLGYFRQCDVIPYSQDVDIGVFIKNFNATLIAAFTTRGLKLKHKFGRINDGLELSFTFRAIKLDIFFFYEEKNYYWNGGHALVYREGRLDSGIKYRYKFPKFTLCWTEFLEMKVRIPCETENYISANYGPEWFQPRAKWHWYKDPYNVEKAGVWQSEDVPEVLQLF